MVSTSPYAYPVPPLATVIVRTWPAGATVLTVAVAVVPDAPSLIVTTSAAVYPAPLALIAMDDSAVGVPPAYGVGV